MQIAPSWICAPSAQTAAAAKGTLVGAGQLLTLHSKVLGVSLPSPQLKLAGNGENPGRQRAAQLAPCATLTPARHAGLPAFVMFSGALQPKGRHWKLLGVREPLLQ